MSECLIDFCSSITGREERGHPYSAKYCLEHSKGVLRKCVDCDSEINVQARFYIKSETKEFVCSKCSRIRHNRSDAMVQKCREMGLKYGRENGKKTGPITSKKNFKKYRESEAFKDHIAELARKNAEKWRNSEEGKKNAQELGLKYGPITGKDNITAFNQTERGKEIKIENARRWRESERGKIHMKNQALKNINSMIELGISGVFDRDSFYSSKFDIIDFEENGSIITFKDIDSLKSVPGVWAKLSSSGSVLDVSKTIDIGREILFSTRAFDLARKNINKPDDYFNKYRNPGLYKKYVSMLKHEKENGDSNIVFKLVCVGIKDEAELEAIEAQYAHDNKALFWSFAPGQKGRIKHI